MLQFLDSAQAAEVCQEAGLDSGEIDAVRQALETDDFDHEQIEVAAQRLFERFTEQCDDRYDPNGVFNQTKGVSLQELQPIVSLLTQSTESVEVKTVGSNNAEPEWRSFDPQLLLVDYNLEDSPTETTPVEDPSKLSLQFLNSVLASPDDLPSIVLMSSKDLPNPKGYRQSAGDRLLAVRFGLLDKRTAVSTGETPNFSNSARHVLLDACQGYRFGNVLEDALTEWNKAATRALEKLNRAIRDLDAKDFAYLIRFRLTADATGLANYIDWLFGEHLRGLTEREICWTHGSFVDLDGDERLHDMIEGAHDGATDAIARIYHSVRVGGRRNRESHEYRLGDLFVQKGTDKILVVITPDCDLIAGTAGGRTRRPKVTNVLTMTGTLYQINAKQAVADELLLRNDTPYYVGWRTKELSTVPLEGDQSLHRHPEFRVYRYPKAPLRPPHTSQSAGRPVENRLARRAGPRCQRSGRRLAKSTGLRRTSFRA